MIHNIIVYFILYGYILVFYRHIYSLRADMIIYSYFSVKYIVELITQQSTMNE